MHIKLIYVCSLGSLAALVINQVRIYSCACVRVFICWCVYVFVLCIFIFLPHFICMHELLCTHFSANCAIIARFILTYVMHSAFEIFTRTERRSCERSKLNLWYLRLRYYTPYHLRFVYHFPVYTLKLLHFLRAQTFNFVHYIFRNNLKKTSTINGNGIVLLMLSKHPF